MKLTSNIKVIDVANKFLNLSLVLRKITIGLPISEITAARTR